MPQERSNQVLLERFWNKKETEEISIKHKTSVNVNLGEWNYISTFLLYYFLFFQPPITYLLVR
eukprot:TRINITY_DN26_c0_g2_i1.p1 TRINITY_DN26_c0_g2~~TRINITY_DN26_c0_g2_i1.p1  ORF type:complete len:63 (+),score=1.46 TRINITY_DN26_c0_g2_i1:305-493(+)